EHRLILLGAGRTAHLVQRWGRRLQQGKFPAPEFAQAALLFRLQRFGVHGPRLLAMGHRRVSAWQRYAFLLTEPPLGPSLATVPAANPQAGEALSRADRLRVLLGYLQQRRLDAGARAIASGDPLTRKRERRVA